MSTAREHALLASNVLDTERALEAELDGLDADKRLQLAATGQVRRLNEDRRFAIEVAQAHALTALALVWTALASPNGGEQ